MKIDQSSTLDSTRCAQFVLCSLLSGMQIHALETFLLHVLSLLRIVLKSGPVWWVDPGPSQPGVETELGWKKNMKKKTQYDPANLASWPSDPVDPVRPDQKLGCNLLTFVFFVLLKRHRFNFFLKKLIRVTQLKFGTRALDQADHRSGLKSMHVHFLLG